MTQATVEIPELDAEQQQILIHTLTRAANQRYCGDSPAMQSLVRGGLMMFAGKQAWCPDKYYRLTARGKAIAQELARRQREACDAGRQDAS